MHTQNLRKGKEALIFSLQTPTARVVLKWWEEDTDVVTLRQVHSSKVFLVEDFVQGLEGDALITQRRGLKIGVRTADCVPVALLGKKAVAVVHAGWRGLRDGIIEKVLERLRPLEPPENYLAFIGPSARACCYEVGEEFKGYFLSLQIRNGGHYMDTQSEAILRLKRGGIRKFFQHGVCTICHDSLPSYRRDKTRDRILTFVELLV
ncbi:MAG: polyphenol oxidase family protein [Aquificaceae bacterium]|jgi:YfiH family protein|uniref:polyphenol oxidase family protein n=1 Tax=Hydrogenobacter sp. Uz 6-8 TaxID=3384828 RepID=UPI000F2511A3|nr:MAG: laccase domain-containing protein [Aquificota bacterium]